MSHLRSFLIQLLITLLMAVVLLSAYVIGGRLVLMPALETQKHRLETLLAEQIGQTVTIGRMKGGWSFFSPVLAMKEVSVGEGDTRLEIGTVSAELDLSSTLYHRLPVFKRILVDRVDLQVHQEYINQFNLRNPLQGGSGKMPDLSALKKRPAWLDWLERQDNIILRDWKVINQHPDDVTETLMIRRVAWRNQGQQHSLEGDIAWGLDEGLADIFVSADIHGPLWPLGQQDGDIYLLVDQQQWSRWVPETLPRDLTIRSMRASLEGWLSLADGDLKSLYIRAVVPEFSVEAPDNTLALTNGTLMISGERRNEDWHLQILPRFSEPLPVREIRLSSVRLDDDRGWNLRVPSADLAEASQFLLDFNLMPEPFDRYLENLAPTGQGENVRLSYLFRAGEFDMRANVSDFSVQPYKGIPALARADGEVHLQKLGGVARIRDNDLTMHLPDIYQPQWDLTNASADFYWKIEPELFRLHLQDLDAHLDDTRVRGELALRIPREVFNVENYIALQLGVEEGPVGLQQKLVPDIIDPAINDWLDTSLLEGRLTDVGFVLSGTLGDNTPDNSMTTQLALQAEQAKLNYLDGWPLVTDVRGSVYLDAPDVDVSVLEGHTLGGTIVDQSGEVTIRSRGDDVMLHVEGRLEGRASEALSYLQTTPLAEVLDGALETWKASGQATTDLRLDVSLSDDNSDPQVDLTTQLRDTRLQITDIDMNLQSLNGALSFNSDTGLWADALEGQLFGGPVTMKVSSQVTPDTYLITLSGEGEAQWTALSPWFDLFLLDPISGSLTYHSEVFIDPEADEPVQILLESDLVGTQIDLPFPMGKVAEQPRSLTALIRSGDETRFNINYDHLVRTALTLDAANNTPRGEVLIGGEPPEHTSGTGIAIRGHLDERIYAEPWWDAFDHLLTLSDEADAKARAAGEVFVTDSLGNTNPVASLDLSFADVDVYDYPSGPMTVTGTQTRGQWDIRADSDLVAGDVTLPADTAAPLILALDYVRLPAEDESAEISADAGTATPDPMAIPPDPLADVLPTDVVAMDVSLQEFYYGTRNLGSWQVNARPVEQGVRVNFLDTDMKGVHITGPMDWQIVNGEQTTQLAGLELKASNVQEVQKAFRQQAIIKGKDMDSQVNLTWLGSPLGFNTQTLNGTVAMRIREGSVDLEGAAAMRAVGTLNVNALFRRLRLDFSDVVNSGMAFDTLKGKAEITQGLLTLAEPVMLEGPGGKLLTSGTANLNSGELDMKLAVTFPITGTLPLVAVLAGFAPPVAASIYVTERLVGDELERFTSASYSIKGTVSQPDVQLNKAFDNSVDGKKSRSFMDRFLSIFGLEND